ncbi:hypothetical protein HPB50_021499 [Hyalomma asiaticum]|uniref:Uncharacterized protein n=1 Tax=Hyalomma asiaticum TaxID=266040 RepID=A0ACB7SJF1_HYAAI|nr:hypothetical protein HPB50_021499 [Hyalomma asiaticum]
MGMGVVCVTLIIVVMMYFDKYRGVASGLKFAGYTLASLLFPKILTSLRDAYGFRGTLLVYASLTMNVTALTLLLKEPPWQLKGRKKDTNAPAPDGRNIFWISPTASHDAASTPVRGQDSVSSKAAGSGTSCAETGNTRIPSGVGETHNACKWTKKSEAPATRCNSGNEYPARNRKNTNPVRTWLLGFRHSGGQATANHVMTTENRNKERRPESVNQVARSTEAKEYTMHKRRSPCSLFGEIGNLLAKPRFYVCVLAVVAIDYTVAIFPATIVDYALDKGASRSHADLSVTYCSPAELCGRIVLPLIGDSKMVSRAALVSASFFLLAVTMLALPTTPSFLAYILVCACMTMLIACLVSMKPVVIADYFGIESVATSWGFAGVTLIPLHLCSPYIIGKLSFEGAVFFIVYCAI